MVKKKAYNWKDIFKAYLVLQISIYMATLLGQNAGVELKIANLICGSIGFSLGIMTLFKQVKSNYKYIGIGFLIVGILEGIKLCSFAYGIENFKVNIILSATVGNLEFLIPIVALLFLNKKLKSKECIKIYILLILINYLYILEIYSLKKLRVNFWMNIFLAIGTLIYYSKKYKKEQSEINIYILGIIGNSFLKLIYSECGEHILLDGAIICRALAYLSIYKGVNRKIFEIEKYKLKDDVRINNLQKETIEIEIEKEREKLLELNKMKKKEEEEYYELIDKFDDGIFIYENKKIIYINKKGLEFLEIENIENYSDSLLENNLIIESNSDNGVKAGILKKDGFIQDVQIYGTCIRESKYILYIKDMTKINKYKRVRSTYQKILLKEKIKNEFYTNVSHELRTPINVISTALDLNKLRIEQEDFEGIKENNRKIKRNCLRLIRTINNFIDANKISDGYLLPEKTVCNMVEFVERIVSVSYKYISCKKGQIYFDFSEDELLVDIDRDLIERVILNLISNGLKHRDKERECIIEIDICSIREYILIIITNNGTLINEIEESFLFDEFTKINKGLNRENEGSGLGLYLSKAIINAHNGEIKFKRRKGKNNFIIKLPKALSGIVKEEESNINSLEERVQLEFSDLYL